LRYDLCVYGGSAAAVVAAAAAARQGRSVLLANPGGHLGGLSSGGLGATDAGNPDVVGGMAREFYAAMGKVYGEELALRFEPHQAEKYFNALAAGKGITILTNSLLAKVQKDKSRLRSLTFQQGGQVEASYFIDASYEGDLMAQAGVRYAVGREASAQYGEDLNGIQAKCPSHQFEVDVDPWAKEGDPKSGLLPCIQPGDGGKPGDGDKRVQAYNFRLCLTQDPNNRLPILPPANYDARQYALMGRTLRELLRTGRTLHFTDFFLIVRMPNGKTDFNNNGFFSTDFIGESWAYPDADHAIRQRLWKRHEDYMRGLFHYLATDEAVPPSVREEARTWGLCKDEFQDLGGWSHQLYVREGRRMLGRYVVTQNDCQAKVKVDDAVAMGSYTMDSHHCQRVVRQGVVVNEGDVQVGLQPYPISYRALIPQARECENLLVPVCLSASHIAYGSIRMEPVFMQLGQACGLAVSQVLDSGKPVQEVDVPGLQKDLRESGAVLEYSGKKPEGWAHDKHVIQ
jgi:hypothetical protein